MRIHSSGVRFDFPESSLIAKYDEWAFFRKRFRHTATGTRGVDAVCVNESDCWLIEIKRRARTVGVASEYPARVDDVIRQAAEQVRDTLAGLAAASRNASGEERRFAAEALRATRWRVALHLEQIDRTSRLHPSPYPVADATMKLRQRVHAIDPQAVVVDSSGDRNPSNTTVPWTARRLSAGAAVQSGA